MAVHIDTVGNVSRRGQSYANEGRVRTSCQSTKIIVNIMRENACLNLNFVKKRLEVHVLEMEQSGSK